MADSLLDNNQQSDEDRSAIIAKWKDKPQDELLNAKAESDLYIKTLTARLDDLKKDYLTLREQHQASTDLKDMIDQLRQRQSNPEQPLEPKREDQTAIKLEDIEALVSQKLSQHQIVQKQKENFNTIQAKLREQLGSNFQEAYKQRLGELDLTPEFADDLAKNHPALFLKTFDLESMPSKASDFSPPRPSIRQASFKPAAQKRDWNYYQEMKKANPKLYLDPKIAIQMHDDAIALGADFGMPD